MYTALVSHPFFGRSDASGTRASTLSAVSFSAGCAWRVADGDRFLRATQINSRCFFFLKRAQLKDAALSRSSYQGNSIWCACRCPVLLTSVSLGPVRVADFAVAGGGRGGSGALWEFSASSPTAPGRVQRGGLRGDFCNL